MAAITQKTEKRNFRFEIIVSFTSVNFMRLLRGYAIDKFYCSVYNYMKSIDGKSIFFGSLQRKCPRLKDIGERKREDRSGAVSRKSEYGKP